MRAIKFFHDLNLLMHCPSSKVNHLVFVDVKPILDQVSALIGVSFIDRSILDDILPNLPTDPQGLLKDHGRFFKSILDSSFSFSAPFTSDVFLDLLEHLCMIARIEKSGQTVFFLPSALPYAPDCEVQEKEQASNNPWILRLKTRRHAVPVNVPILMGYLPTLIISLLNSPKFEADDICQYRNLMSISYVCGGQVYIIESNLQLEFYYSWDDELPEECAVIRSEVKKVLVEVEEKLHFKEGMLIKEDAFVCFCNGRNPRHYCTYNWISKRVVCEKTKRPCHLSTQQKHWLSQVQGTANTNNYLHVDTQISELCKEFLIQCPM